MESSEGVNEEPIQVLDPNISLHTLLIENIVAVPLDVKDNGMMPMRVLCRSIDTHMHITSLTWLRRTVASNIPSDRCQY